ncbi:MAG TPA: FAD-binding oxidoreductase [Candidatus Eisenbacteria bacterium]|nr:FAD-binding oxidoreductase [Candidatus Eisenbacteria bacterium]
MKTEVGQRQDLAVDGLVPSTTMSPGSVAAAAADLGRCYEEGLAVIPQGGRTQIGLGGVPHRYDVAFSTTGLSRLLEHEPADLTCRVEAGMRLGDLQAVLNKHGQRLPLDPPHPEEATVGGLLAANTNGLGRGRYGTVRDWVIGITVLYPVANPARVARAGGKVVKNVAGYDLMKLHIGALGTLGVLAEVNFKVQTVPEASADLIARFDTPAAALRCGHGLALGYLLPAAMAVLNREALGQCGVTALWPWVMAARLEGYQAEVAAGRDRVTAAVKEAGGQVEELAPGFWDAARGWPAAPLPAVVLRAATSLTGVPRLVDAIGTDASVMAQPGVGVVHVRPLPGMAEPVVKRLREALGPGGSVVVERAPAAQKPSLNVWGPPPTGFGLMRGLKASLDPRGILNPGRFVGDI